MRTIDTAKFIDMATVISLCAMLAYMAVLFIIFLIRYIAGCIWISEVSAGYQIGSPAQKRVSNRTVHDRRHSPFAGSPDDVFSTVRERKTEYAGE